MELFLCYFFVKWKLPVIVCSLESLLLKNLWKFRIRHRHLNLLYRRILVSGEYLFHDFDDPKLYIRI